MAEDIGCKLLALASQRVELDGKLWVDLAELAQFDATFETGVDGIEACQWDVRLAGQGTVNIQHSQRVLKCIGLGRKGIVLGILDSSTVFQQDLDDVIVVVMRGKDDWGDVGMEVTVEGATF